MSWKPSRNSGVLFDKYDKKAQKYRAELDRIMAEWNPPTFAQLNYLSKCFYLWYLNENKKREAITGKTGKRENLECFCPPYYLKLFKNNLAHIYKPFLKILSK